MKKRRREFTPAKRKETRRRVMFYVSVIFGIAIIAASVYIGVFSDIPKVRAVEVLGNRLVGKEEIISQAEKLLAKESWWRGALGKDHILFWLGGKIQKIKEAVPKLRAAEARLNIRQRIITIEVKEEEAKGVWCAPDGKCFVFNEDGILFAEAPEVRGYLIAKIIGEEGVPLGIGDEVLGNAAWFQNMRKTIEGVEGAGIRIKAVNMKDRNKKEWSIETAEGIELLFGLEKVPESVGLILKELQKEKSAKGRIIDFRVPEKVYIR